MHILHLELLNCHIRVSHFGSFVNLYSQWFLLDDSKEFRLHSNIGYSCATVVAKDAVV